jgi:GNAT superfamily N-acetyltransferase
MELFEYIPSESAEEFDVSAHIPTVALTKPKHKFEAHLVTSFSDFERVVAIRRSVFCDECGYDEDNEFDGNDLCAAHILLSMDSNPIACARIRFFADFVLLERFSVLPAYRHSLAAQHLSRAALAYAAAKGYRRVFGVVRDRFVNFWIRMGGFVREDIGPMKLGRYEYFPVELPIPSRFSRGSIEGDVDALLAREADSFLPMPRGLRDALSARPPQGAPAMMAH